MRLGFLTLVAGLLLAAPAQAYKLGGASWPTRTITYYDGGPDKTAVRTAVRAWNTSGVNLRFKPVSRSRAQVVIRRLRGDKVCLGGHLGFAQLGYAPGRQASMELRKCNDSLVAATAATHEFGHILGLDHEDRRCSLMNGFQMWGGCKQPPDYSARCDVLTPDDVRGAIKRYGGRARKRPPTFCPMFDAPRPPTSLSITGTAPGGDDYYTQREVMASFNVTTGKPRYALGKLYPPPPLTAMVYRYPATCPGGEPSGKPLREGPAGYGSGKVEVPIDDRLALAPGRYCYAIWVRDEMGRRAASPVTQTVTISRRDPQPAFEPPSYAYAGEDTYFSDASDTGEGDITAWQWNFGDAASPANTSSERNASHVYSEAGTYTVTLTITDDLGRQSTASHQVVVETLQ